MTPADASDVIEPAWSWASPGKLQRRPGLRSSQVKMPTKLQCEKVSFKGIHITQQDFDRLSPGVHLNDNLIDFYIELLLQRDKPEQFGIKIFNTHLFRKIEVCFRRA